MGFLNKTRGMKLLGKDKKKPQKNEQKPTEVKPVMPQQPAVAQPAAAQLHIQIPRLAVPTANPTPTPTIPSLSAQMGSSPWWVSDVTFVVEGRKIPGHKVVLQSRSEYFTKLFEGATATQEFTIDVQEFSHHTFSQFVRWVYGGKKDVPLEDVPELLRCANHYEAPELVSLCSKILSEQMPQASPPAIYSNYLPTEYSNNGTNEAEAESEAEAQEPVTLSGHFPEFNNQMLDPSMIDIPTEMDFSDPSEIDQYLDPSLTMGHNFEVEDSFGMTMWSNDPILFNPETNDAFRIMEIC